MSTRSIYGAKAATLITVAGLPGSASTWAYNAVKLLLENCYPRVYSTYSDDLNDALCDAVVSYDVVLIKSHVPRKQLAALNAISKGFVVVTVRDPRDAIVSLMQRFGFDFEIAFRKVLESLRAIDAMCKGESVVLLRYEDHFTASPATIMRLAEELGVKASTAFCNDLFDSLRPAMVRERIQELRNEGRILEGSDDSERFDPDSHWHLGHVGDGAINKYMGYLNAAEIRLTDIATRDFCNLYNYDLIYRGIELGTNITFGALGVGSACITEGSYEQEPWGIWTQSDKTVLTIYVVTPPPSETATVSVRIDCATSPEFRLPASKAEVRIFVDGICVADLQACESVPETLSFLSCRHAYPDSQKGLEIVFQHVNVKGLHYYGLSADKRPIGVALNAVVIDSPQRVRHAAP